MLLHDYGTAVAVEDISWRISGLNRDTESSESKLSFSCSAKDGTNRRLCEQTPFTTPQFSANLPYLDFQKRGKY
jgi:hypothetical protein